MADDIDGLDLDELIQAIKTEDVLIVRFQNFEERLLLDMRLGDDGRPLVRMVDPVSSPEERYKELREIRPEVALPERIMVVPWPRSYKELVRLGLWGYITDRIMSVTSSSGEAIVEDLQGQIARCELLEFKAMIHGEIGYETLWEKSPS